MRCHDEQGEREADGSVVRPEVDVTEHFGLVYEIAFTFRRPGRDLDDLVATGCLGLVEAFKKYRADAGCEFSTYAYKSIKNRIIRHLHASGWPIRVPRDLSRYIAAERRGEPIPVARTPKGLRILQRRMDLARQILDAQTLTTDGQQGLVIQESLASDRDRPTANLEQIENEMEAVAVTRDLLGRLANRWPRDATVIRLRYGLDGTRPMTAEEISPILGISRQAVNSAEAKALERLRALAGTDGGAEGRERRERLKRLNDRRNQNRNEKRRTMRADKKAERKAGESATQERGADAATA